MRALRIVAPDGSTTGHVDIRKPFTVEVEYQIFETLPQFRLALRVVTPDGTVAFTTSESADPSYETKSCAAGYYTARCFVPGNLLNEGFYSLMLSADIPLQKVLFVEEGVIGFLLNKPVVLTLAFRKNGRVLFALNSNGKTSHLLKKIREFWGRHKLFDLYESHL
jgi:hypothetical protein